MRWPDFLSALSYYAQQEQPDASFTAATPTFVNNAELRIYRDLDFAATSGQNTSLQTVAFSKTIDLTVMTGQTVAGTAIAYQFPVVVQNISARVGNAWVPFQLVSQDYLDMIWPNETVFAAPATGLAYYTMLDAQTAKIAPVPDSVYPLRVTGTWRPAPISAANPETWLSSNLPDLFFAAVMIEVMGYQRNFGAQSDDPRAAISWTQRYDEAKRSAMMEEAVRKGLGPGFQPFTPTPLANPPPPPPAG